MIALAALPQKWEMLISIVTGDTPIEDLTLAHVHQAVLSQHQLEAVRGGTGKHNANKISVVKRKRGSPNFNNQQGNQQQQQNQQQGSSNDGQTQRKRGKGKGKQQQQQHQHSHIANVTSLAPPTSSTIALPGPSGIQKRTVHQSAPKEQKPGPYKALNATIDTAQASGSTPTI